MLLIRTDTHISWKCRDSAAHTKRIPGTNSHFLVTVLVCPSRRWFLMHHNPPRSLEHIKDISFYLCKWLWRPPAHHKHTCTHKRTRPPAHQHAVIPLARDRRLLIGCQAECVCFCVCMCVCVCTAELGLLRNSRHVREPRLRRCSSFEQTDMWGGGERGREG